MSQLRLPYPPKEAISSLLQGVYGKPAPDVSHFYNITKHGFIHQGEVETCKYLKNLYVQAIHIALRRTIRPIPFRKSNSKGHARDLYPYISDLLSDDPNRVRSVLTVLRLCYLIKTRPEVDVNSITSPPQGPGWSDAQWNNFKSFTHNWVIPEKLTGTIRVIPRARSGPNGASSLLTGHLDAEALEQDENLLNNLHGLAEEINPGYNLKDWVISLSNYSKSTRAREQDEDLLDSLQGIAEVMNPGFDLGNWSASISDHSESIEKPKKWKPRIHSRLAALAEGGCKTRVIAIGDLFSQIVLLPIHNFLMDRLRKLSQDGTHDQSRSITFVKRWTKKGPVYSYDLTTATDRFPVLITSIVMSALLGPSIAQKWLAVMTERDFSLPQGSKAKTVRYVTGQPMGLYSSWPAFAFSHHVFLKYCAFLEGVTSFSDYTIIGDDVVIAHPAVAKRYRTELFNLGVPISENKSLVSEDPPYHAEICKQILFDGKNLSPIPADLIKVAIKEPSFLYALLEGISNRYGVMNSHAPRLSLLKLVDIYSRNSQRAKALILLTAPRDIAPQSLYKALAKYQGFEDDESYTESQFFTTSPWGKIDLEDLFNKNSWGVIDTDVYSHYEQISDLSSRVSQILREKVLRTQFETMSIEWSLIQFMGYSEDCLRSRSEIPTPELPLDRARVWVREKVEALLEAPDPHVDEDSMVFLEEYGVRYIVDPHLRSYMDRRLIKSKTASRLTLETFKVLKSELPYPEMPSGPISGAISSI